MAKMNEDDIRQAVLADLESAIEYIDERIAPQRETTTSYYRGDNFTEDQEGRSNVVCNEVRDTVLQLMPSLMRIFFGAERTVEFLPRQPEDVAMADQATDYVNYIIRNDNPGFTTIYNAIKDALIRKAGIFKWWWDEDEEVETVSFTGLDEQTFMALLSGDGVEVEKAEQYAVDESGALLTDCTVRRTRTTGRARFACLPPEEFLICEEARSIEEARFVAHRCLKSVGDMVAMGYDFDEMADMASPGRTSFATNEELETRLGFERFGDDLPDKSSWQVLYYECYRMMDVDGDGVNELVKVCMAGEEHKVLAVSPVAEKPFAAICPDPEPHTFFGLCPADVVLDVQRIKSQILRNMLDSLAQSINPRTWAVEGQVNLNDLLNNEVGGVVRVRAPAMVGEMGSTFVGQQAFPMLSYLDDLKETRTGVTKAAAGLDPDAMQSTTKAAVAATIQAAQGRIELVARIFAETGIRDLYRGLFGLVTRHQDQARMIRLRNQWVAMDPRHWKGGMDVVVNVGLGSGNVEERMAFLGQILQVQQTAMQQLGPQNPLVDLTNIRTTLGKMVELAGWTDASLFFKDPAQQPPIQPPQESEGQEGDKTAFAIVQAEQIKAQTRMQIEQMKLRVTDARERDKMVMDYRLKIAELQAKGAMHVYDANLEASLRTAADNPDPTAMPAQQ